MVLRPSLKRVGPGSRRVGARSFLFSSLCFPRVSKSVLLLEPKFGQILRVLNLRAFWAGPRRSFCALAVALPRVAPGSLAPARACFSWPRRCFGLPRRFTWPCRGFRLPAIKTARQPFVIITLDPLSEHFRGRNAFGFARRRTSKLVGRAATQLDANSKSSPSRWGCFTKHFSADVVSWPLARRNSQLLSALAAYCLPPANLSCLLLADFCSSSLTSSVALRARPLAALLSLRSLCSVALVWKLTLGSGPGWVGLRSKLLIDVAKKISMSQIL